MKIELVEKDGIMVGEDFTIEWNMINTSQQVQDISRLHLELYSKFYTGEIKSKIFFKPLSGFKLEGKKGSYAVDACRFNCSCNRVFSH